MFVCFTDLPVVVKEWRGVVGGWGVYLSEQQRRTGDGEGKEGGEGGGE